MSFLSGWLTKSTSGDPKKQAHCLVCVKDLRAHQTDLEKHGSFTCHQKNMKRHPKQPKITKMYNVHTEEKKRDLNLAAYIACHSSIRSVDHLGELLKKLDPGFKNLELHRQKCTNLIKYVIAPNMLSELIADIGNRPYSLIVDESTDITTKKYLALCVKYFSIKQNRIIIDFLGIIELEKADAITLHTKVKKFLEDIELPISNLVGLGTDGGSNLCGKNHSLFTLLSSNNSKLQLIRCVCHTLNLAASDAAKEFPAAVEFLCTEVYKWFKYSTTKKESYEKLWDTMNKIVDGQDETKNKIFHQFVRLSGTRWLARYKVVKVLLEHYFELRIYFDDFVKVEKNYMARVLKQMLDDDANYLYLLITKPILYQINEANIAFQAELADISSSYYDLKNLIQFVARKIFTPECMSQDFQVILKTIDNNLAYLNPNKVDYGVEYNMAVTKLTHDIELTKDQVKRKKQRDEFQKLKEEVEGRAFQYLKRLLSQLAERLPENLNHFEKVKNFSPDTCLKIIGRPKFQDLAFVNTFVPTENLGLLDMQYDSLLNVPWNEILSLEEKTDCYKFWYCVYNYKNTGGRFPFRELAEFALTVLSLPSSNAVVERVFSVMNSVKTKLRNRMVFQLLDSLLRIRMHFSANHMCCKDFEPSTKMLKDCHLKILYPTSSDQKNDADKNEIETEEDKEEGEIVDKLLEMDKSCVNLST